MQSISTSALRCNNNVALHARAFVPSKARKPQACMPVKAVKDAVKAPGTTIVDCERAYAESTFSIPPDSLIKRTKEILTAGFNPGIADQLADDFRFIGPVVGPLSKSSYLAAISNFSFKTGFPDLTENFFGFTVDPMEPNRVWYMARGRGTHTGTFFDIEPTGRKYEGAPEISSLTFNEEGKVTKQTVGVVCDRTQGNTGGLGAAFGILYSIGKPLPFPEAQPWKMSWQYRLFSFFGSLRR